MIYNKYDDHMMCRYIQSAASGTPIYFFRFDSMQSICCISGRSARKTKTAEEERKKMTDKKRAVCFHTFPTASTTATATTITINTYIYECVCVCEHICIDI